MLVNVLVQEYCVVERTFSALMFSVQEYFERDLPLSHDFETDVQSCAGIHFLAVRIAVTSLTDLQTRPNPRVVQCLNRLHVSSVLYHFLILGHADSAETQGWCGGEAFQPHAQLFCSVSLPCAAAPNQ